MFKKLLVLFATFFLSSPALLCQGPPCTNVPIPCARVKLREVDLQVLVNLEKENARAIQLGNSSFFNDAYADDFTGMTSYGLALTKYKLIQLIQTSNEKYKTVIASDIQVKMFLDSASVLSLRTEHSITNGKAVSRQFRVLRVYVYSSLGWKVVSQLETQLPGSIPR
jgi:hypothetical protein